MNVHNQNQILNQRISKLQTEFILIDHGLCPDWSRETHRRRRDSIYLILDGKGMITINGETIYPKENNMVLLPKNSLVSLYSENETCYNKYWCDFLMHFDGVSLFDVIDFPYMIELDDISHALELFKRLDELHLKTDTGSALMLKSTLLELAAMFLENDTRERKRGAASDPFADTMKSFICEHISEKLSVKTLADKMGFNEKYFIEVFKQHFGTTPAQYVKSARLETAKHELLYTDNKILYIPNKIGYSSLQKLSRDFKAYTGFTPSEFRKKFK
ncbi:MAG: AraC family transcriptional regulator [Candidatus Ornithomonoglobus sp.]